MSTALDDLIRERLYEIICEAHDNTEEGWDARYWTADAIIAALPGLVKPLEWEDMDHYEIARTALGDYEAGWDDGAWAQCDGPSMWEWSSNEDHRGLTVYDAKAAAQAHYTAQIMAAFGIDAGAMREGKQ